MHESTTVCADCAPHGKLAIKHDLQELRVAEVVRRHKGPLPKSLNLDKNFKPKHTLFCRNINICRDLRTFWRTWG